MSIFRYLKIVKWEEDNEGIVTCNNLTLINFVLIKIGATKESDLTMILIFVQVYI